MVDGHGQKRRLIAIGLDGFEISIAERMMAKGELPAFARLKAEAARFDLDHGRARATGLAWEHFASGRAPEQGGRWSAVRFDPTTYGLAQPKTRMPPVFAAFGARVVAFDVPYLDLDAAGARGLSAWGAHDPGVAAAANPPDLADEIAKKFGPYPATRWIYGFTWPSAERTREAAEALEQASEKRGAIFRWLLSERMPDWDLAMVTVAEPHSAVEQFWHGVDPAHPLHALPSAAAARAGVEGVYRRIDEMIAGLREDHPDAGVLVFAMHGMGPNHGDLPAMALLPEFMYRLAFGRPLAARGDWRTRAADGSPVIEGDRDWHDVVNGLLPWPHEPAPSKTGLLARWFGRAEAPPIPIVPSELDWMPAALYRPHWPKMRAFAFPAFYDGQIRLNVVGREARGLVAEKDFLAERDRIVAALRGVTREPGGGPVVSNVWYPRAPPMARDPHEPDIFVEFAAGVTGFSHPKTGAIGPYPHRRTGGHTGEKGFCWLLWPGETGDRGWRSSFDVVPTIFALTGRTYPNEASGRPLVEAGASVPLTASA